MWSIFVLFCDVLTEDSNIPQSKINLFGCLHHPACHDQGLMNVHQEFSFNSSPECTEHGEPHQLSEVCLQ